MTELHSGDDWLAARLATNQIDRPTDPVAREARDRLAALLHDVPVHMGWDYPEDAWFDQQADRLLAAGVLPPDTLAKVRAEIEALRQSDNLAATYPPADAYNHGLADALAALEASSGTPEPRGTICKCGSAKSYHRPQDHRDHEYEPRSVPPPAAPGLPAELRALSEAATIRGPLRAVPSGLMASLVDDIDGNNPKWPQNAAFIAAATNYVRTLAETSRTRT